MVNCRGERFGRNFVADRGSRFGRDSRDCRNDFLDQIQKEEHMACIALIIVFVVKLVYIGVYLWRITGPRTNAHRLSSGYK